MKIAILTYTNTRNFGAQLQAYALCKYLKNQNHECNVINYSADRDSCYKIIKKYLKDLVKNMYINTKLYNKFKEEYNITKKKYNSKNLFEINNSYDIYISGSDQVWNRNITKVTTNYLLSFTDKKKISYAASFGSKNIDDNLKDIYIEWLKKFDSISVREKSGSEIIMNLINRDSYIVVDPTLLFKKEDWKNMFNISENHEKYVLLYMLEYSKELVDEARKLSKKRKERLRIIVGSPKVLLYSEIEKNMSPKKFVELFYNARCILTNSYHGMLFSINFEKEFYIRLMEKNYKANERILDILNELNLNNRVINLKISISNINYTHIKDAIESKRLNSKEYLNRAI